MKRRPKMAIEFNGKGKNVNNLRVNKDVENSKEVVREEKVAEQQKAEYKSQNQFLNFHR